MRLPEMKLIVSEPVKNGIIIGFAIMSASAAVQLVGSVWFGTSTLDGLAGLATAGFLALCGGSASTIVSSKSANRLANGLKMAEALGKGDFSRSIVHNNPNISPLEIALEQIAERELNRETQRAVVEKDAALRYNQLADALDALPSEIAVYNKDSLLVSANNAFLTYCLEIGAVVALGMSWHEVMSSIAKARGSNLPANERQTWINQQESLRVDARSADRPVRFKTSQGRVIELLVNISVEGNTTEIVNDVTALVELDERAERLRREAAAAESIKLVTISRLSHTIRTPMTGVLAATELLADSNLDERQRERLDIIRRSASTLLGVVQDMFDLASQTVPDEATVLSPVSTKRTALVFHDGTSRMSASVSKLIEQGFEVGCAENMQLLCETLKTLAGKNRLPELVVVPDSTISDQLYALIGTTRNHSGFQIHVESENSEISASGQAAQSDPRTLDLVIAESDEVKRIAYANALVATKLKFRIASTAEESISLALSHKCKLFLIDMTLPDMNGIQAAASIRKVYSAKSGKALIVAMTSHYVDGDKAKCLATGIDDYVLKPTIGAEISNLANLLLERDELKKAG